MRIKKDADRDESEMRRETLLGNDLGITRFGWARLESKLLPKSVCLMKEVIADLKAKTFKQDCFWSDRASRKSKYRDW